MELTEATIKYEFTIDATAERSSYTDTLYFSPQEWEALSQEELDAAKQQRYDNWVSIISVPQVVTEPTAADIQTEISGITSQMAQVAVQYADAVGRLIAADPTATVPPLPVPMAQ